MTKSNMKVDGESISAASSNIHGAAGHSKDATASALQKTVKLSATAGHPVFAALVNGVFDELRTQLPNDIELLIKSYADGLLEVNNATGATDEALAQKWKSGGSLAGGVAALTVAAGAAGIALQGSNGASLQGSSPAFQGGSINLQGQGAQGGSISTSGPSGSPEGGFQPIQKLSKVGLGANDANENTFDQYQKWLNDPNGGLKVRERRGDAAGEVDCTTWAIYRRSQLDPSVQMNDTQRYFGNGIAVAGEFPPASSAGQIDVGSLISNGPGPYGHVMVVEQVISRQPLELRVSEANLDGKFTGSAGNISTSTIVRYSGGDSLSGGSWTVQRPGHSATGLVGVTVSAP